MTLSDKLTTLNTTKQNIKKALTSINCDTSSTPFTDYPLIIAYDLFVSTTGSDSNNGKTPSNAFLTLSKALSIATAGQIIKIASGTYKGVNNCNLTISTDITIVGDTEVIFDGENTRRSGWTISANNTFIKNITFQNASDGGLSISGVGNYIINCVFKNNTGSTGSAIYITGKSNTIIDCVINNNTSTAYGAIYLFMKSTYFANIINCTITNNTASSLTGGILAGYSGTYNIINCIISNNTPTSLMNLADICYVNIKNCVINKGNASQIINQYNDYKIYVTLTNNYIGKDSPTTSDYGNGNFTLNNSATSKTVFNSIEYTKEKMIKGVTTPITLKCLDCNGNGLNGMNLTLKNGSTIITTLTTDSNGLANYDLTITGTMNLTVTNTSTANYNSCVSEVRTINTNA